VLAVALAAAITSWGSEAHRPAAATVERVAAPVYATSKLHLFGARTVRLADGYVGTESPWPKDRPPFFASFTASGPFSVYLKGTGAPVRVRIDGRIARTVRLRADGRHYRVRLALRGRHDAGLELGPGAELAGVAGAIRATTPRTTARALFLGDSFTLGVGGTRPIGFAQRAGWQLGWDVWADGVGGTGYVNTGGKTNFLDRLDTDLASRPGIVVVAGGVNDFGQAPPDAVLDAARKVFARVRGSGARLIVLSPWVRGAGATSEYLAFSDRLKQAATEAGGTYVDTRTWLRARGLLVADGKHPNDRGYDRIAAALVRALR
jgi:lysophospholipase L1-like esterase